jgi:hypothetical protein
VAAPKAFDPTARLYVPVVIASPAVLWSNILFCVGVPLKFASSLAADIVIILYKI